MSIRTAALVFGIVFLLIALSGFIPGTATPHTHPDVTLDAGLGLAMGLFPVNILHNLVHLAFGLWGLAASRSLGGARGYFKGTAIIYATFVVMGLISAARIWTTFGLVPLYGNDVWLHGLIAAGAAYFGFMHRDRGADSRR
jgi:hypothetical protein